MARLPWFQFWVTDYIAETSRWSVADEGAYVRLLCAIWQNAAENDDPSLPDDTEQITDLLGISERDWERLKKKLTNRPKSPLVIAEGRIRHVRITESYEHAVGLSERGRKGGIAKRDNRTLRNSTQVEPKQNSSSTQGVALQTSDMRHQTTEDMGTPTSQVSTLVCSNTHMSESAREKNDDVTTALSVPSNLPARSNGNGGADFERFIEAYPKHRARGAAYDAWALLRRNGRLPPIETILADIERHKQCDPNWRTERFTPNPARYLSDELWHDQYQTPGDNALVQALAEGR